MSEYQRYEFMAIDKPLTAAQLSEVNGLSSHIEASSSHALIEYHWGDFKHDPIKVLRKYFDGFLYWANWGSPRLALRFPHGLLPANFIEDYDYDDYVTFVKHPDFDILDMHFGEMEALDEWVEYELGPLISLRDELIEGDLRPLYILWLACQPMIGDYDEEEEDERESEEDYEISKPTVPPGFGTLTAAQQALAELFRVPQEVLDAVARHSIVVPPSKSSDDFVAWVKLLPQDRSNDYLVRLAKNEPGLSRILIKELRELGLGKTKATPPKGEYVSYGTLVAEGKVIEERQLQEQREITQQAHLRRLQEVRTNRDTYWRQIDKVVANSSSSGYDEATRLLVELREAADHFNETEEFQARFRSFVQSYQRRSALMRRLRDHNFTLPGV